MKTNSIKYCMSLDSYSTKQAVIFNSFMKNHKIKIPKTFLELFFTEVGFHEHESRLIFMNIHKNIFMSVYRIDPREKSLKNKFF